MTAQRAGALPETARNWAAISVPFRLPIAFGSLSPFVRLEALVRCYLENKTGYIRLGTKGDFLTAQLHCSIL